MIPTVFLTLAITCAIAGWGFVALRDRERRSIITQPTEAIQFLASAEQSLLTMHLENFPRAVRSVLPLPARPDIDTRRTVLKKQALRGVPVFRLALRRQAANWANEIARSEARAQWQQRLRQHAAQQARLDDAWDLLVAHDEQTVCEAVEAAFEAKKSPVTCIDVGTEDAERYVTVLILFGPDDLVPERGAALTPAGVPTLHKRSETERNDFYVKALGSAVLATVREGFAAVPNATEFRVVVLRIDPQAPSAATSVEWIYAARFPRHWTARLPWNALDPAEILVNAPHAKMQRRGDAGTVVGMPLANEPRMQAIVSAVRAAV